MNEILWSFDRLCSLLGHEDVPVRQWAVERLTKLFPDKSQERLVALLDDPDQLVFSSILGFLESNGKGTGVGQALTEQLRRADCKQFGRIAHTLAAIGHTDGLPVVLEHLEGHNSSRKTMPFDELAGLIPALGIWGGDAARKWLWVMVEGLPKDSLTLPGIIAALLTGGMPEDASGLAALCRSLASAADASGLLSGFAMAVGASRLMNEVERGLDTNLEDALENARLWLGEPPALSAGCLAELNASMENDCVGAMDVMWRESIRLVSDRGEDSSAWVADWLGGNRPTGYRQRVVITQFTLAAFAANESRDPERRMQETALGLALLCQLSVDRDDEAAYESADDKAAVLLDILSSDREIVLDDVVEKAAALGPDLVPALIERFDPDGDGWGYMRIARAIERIARRYPGSCDAAIPVLIEAVNDRQGDFMLEDCHDALGAIGPAAVEGIAAHLLDDDIARKIYFCSALGSIPTETSARAILDVLDQGEPFDEMHASALLDIGSASGIDVIQEAWQATDMEYLAECLLVLHEINGIEHPDIPKWRQVTTEHEERFARRAAMLNAPASPTSPALIPSSTGHSSSKKRKSISSAERKKRAAHRKMNARKKRR